MIKVTQFQGSFRFLSNFYRIFGDSTVEHHYQAAKTQDAEEKQAILEAPTPYEAKKLGSKATLRPDWDEIKYDVMKILVMNKFRDPELAFLLLSTEDWILEEGNTWGDTYWGIDLNTGNGENNLGKILMETRAWLRG